MEAGKHIFLEKPMADAPGLWSVMESAELAKKKGLAVVAVRWRYHYARREFFKRIADGAIGDVQTMYATYYTGPVKPMPPDSLVKRNGVTLNGKYELVQLHLVRRRWSGGTGRVRVDKISGSLATNRRVAP